VLRAARCLRCAPCNLSIPACGRQRSASAHARCLACHACRQGRQLGLPGCACRQGRQPGRPAVLPGRGVGARVARLRSWLAAMQTRAGALPPTDPSRAPIIAPAWPSQAGQLAERKEVNLRMLTDIMRSLATMGYPLTREQAAPLMVGPRPTGRACGGTLRFNFRMHPAGLMGGTLAHHASHALSRMAM